MRHSRVLLIEGCDFTAFPAGGQLSMARSLIKVFGSSLALVGIATGDEPVGRWCRKRIDGTSCLFFAVGRRDVAARKPMIPARLTFFLGLQLYRRRILALGCQHAFTQAPEALIAVSRWGLRSLCYMFPGVENPLRISRYPLARKLCPVFDAALFSSLNRADVILACADERAIGKFVSESHGRISRQRIVKMPTCVDLSEFRPISTAEARRALNLPIDCAIFAACGRINRFKGWQLLVDAFDRLRLKFPRSLLIFVGDGEDRPLLESAIAAHGLESRIQITGFLRSREVSSYLNAADAVVQGSYVEGWSVAMLEALACGKPVVTTPVSGAEEMIVAGTNGLIVPTRDPDEFAAAMEGVLHLRATGPGTAAIVDQYSLPRMGERLSQLWSPLRVPRLKPALAAELVGLVKES